MTRVVCNMGRTHVGELVYFYTYPHAVYDKEKDNGEVKCFEDRPQRACLLIGGAVVHFTRPRKVEVAA